jgi:hypothetical protein
MGYSRWHGECRMDSMWDDREIDATTMSGLVDFFGSYETLARVLNVQVDDLQRWSEGTARVPPHLFSRVIDLKDDAQGIERDATVPE